MVAVHGLVVWHLGQSRWGGTNCSSYGHSCLLTCAETWLVCLTAPFPLSPHLHRFIYLVGCVGAYAFATALCGLAGVKRDRRLQLGAYILLLVLLVRKRCTSFYA